MLKNTENGYPPHFFVWLGTFVCPFLLNIAVILFICFIYSSSAAEHSTRNIICYTTICVHYVIGMIFFGIFIFTTNIIETIADNYVLGLFAAICMTIGYPLYYLFTLPFIVYYLILAIGTPYQLWEKMTKGNCCSCLSLSDSNHAGIMVLKGLYIGLGFFLFLILYIIVFIISIPLLYIFLFPLGFGPFGCCLHQYILERMETIDRLWHLMNTCGRMEIQAHAFGQCLAMIILAAVALGLVGVLIWYHLLLLIVAILCFLLCFYPAVFPWVSWSSKQMV
ncbi:hypothetical protein TVAG_316940 [Trichomonas vaginalis G3]|uniref:Uncharacterized protein n=1 Tax=Trichomonas vaginalis (strain ATCC PRA-98 / G3) TaxID=412133 RepID=A2F071_TRIV3|nr:hypothetical protein TVAGG3_0985640 [Trichomonas vaginalis G3]EAY01706.1 hypothetical protein TVAG_316940 [Trichomonas vaginalis G3]KAI5489641.1 hypothetical protein TVAGG3_0985640 [Trichomonas vaginalis G3]|eukprot:XP_001330402.1 hypothetical protein [Trichomonas vaginalis G3]